MPDRPTPRPSSARLGRSGVVGCLITALLAAGCTSPDPGAAPAERPSSDPTTAAVPGVAASEWSPTPASVRRAHRRLTMLDRIERHPVGLAPYAREAFGSDWADVDGNGCNQRDDVLLRDALTGTVRTTTQGACDHDVLAGTWIDPYTGAELVATDLKDLSQAQAIQIDHVVPLAEAWISGAAGWDQERRRLFANDLDALLASDGPTNAAKGADDPAAWRPRAAFQCAYAVRWIAVKHRWALAVDASEAAALVELLDTCRSVR